MLAGLGVCPSILCGEAKASAKNYAAVNGFFDDGLVRKVNVCSNCAGAYGRATRHYNCTMHLPEGAKFFASRPPGSKKWHPLCEFSYRIVVLAVHGRLHVLLVVF